MVAARASLFLSTLFTSSHLIPCGPIYLNPLGWNISTPFTGTTSGACQALQSQQKSEAASLAAWKTATAQAAQDVLKHRAAVEFHTKALGEAKRLELDVLSEAAALLVAPAARAYADAVAALCKAATELAALQAVAGAAGRARHREGTPLEGLSAFEPPAGAVLVPTLHELNADGGLATPGEHRPATVNLRADKLRAGAVARAHAVADTMRGRS